MWIATASVLVIFYMYYKRGAPSSTSAMSHVKLHVPLLSPHRRHILDKFVASTDDALLVDLSTICKDGSKEEFFEELGRVLFASPRRRLFIVGSARGTVLPIPLSARVLVPIDHQTPLCVKELTLYTNNGYTCVDEGRFDEKFLLERASSQQRHWGGFFSPDYNSVLFHFSDRKLHDDVRAYLADAKVRIIDVAQIECESGNNAGVARRILEQALNRLPFDVPVALVGTISDQKLMTRPRARIALTPNTASESFRFLPASAWKAELTKCCEAQAGGAVGSGLVFHAFDVYRLWFEVFGWMHVTLPTSSVLTHVFPGAKDFPAQTLWGDVGMFNLQDHPEHLARVDGANLNFPIILTQHRGRWYTLDGMHRIVRAVRDKCESIRAIIVDKSVLDRCCEWGATPETFLVTSYYDALSVQQ